MIRKTQNKKYIITAVLLLLAFILSACSSASVLGSADGTEFSLSSLNVIPSDETGTETAAVQGETVFTVLRAKDSNVRSVFPADGEKDVVSLAAAERNNILKSKYCVTMRETVITDVESRVKADVLAGKCDYDALLLASNPTAAALVSSGALKDLNTVAGFDGDGDGFDAAASSALSLSGKQYTVMGTALSEDVYAVSAVIVNNTLLGKSGITGADAGTLMDNALDGSLTWFLIMKYSSEAAAGTGDMCVPSDSALDVFISGGEPIFIKNSVTEMPALSGFGQSAEDIFNTVLSVFDGGKVPDNIPDFSAELPRSLFTVATLGDYKDMLDLGLDVSVLPMPKVADTQSGYFCAVDMKTAMCMAVPAAVKDAETSVRCMNALFALSDGVYNAVKEEMAVTRDTAMGAKEKVSELVDLIYGARQFDLVSMLGFGDFNEFFETSVKTKLQAAVFAARGIERAQAAVKAVEILVDKLSPAPFVEAEETDELEKSETVADTDTVIQNTEIP